MFVIVNYFVKCMIVAEPETEGEGEDTGEEPALPPPPETPEKPASAEKPEEPKAPAKPKPAKPAKPAPSGEQVNLIAFFLL